MNEDIIAEIERCEDCLICEKVCDTYIASGDKLKTPNMRLKISKKVFLEQEITEDERLSLYTCTLCALCDYKCPQEIHISEIIHDAKKKLAEKGKGPLDIHNEISEGILRLDNSVNGNPEDRLEWLPDKYKMEEKYEKSNSTTLLFLGCMSSFKVKESAYSSYELLKKVGYDFKIFKEEPCCGEYLYSSGKANEAIDYFSKVYDLLKENNIKKIIVTCAGCLYAFNNVYPNYFEDFNMEINHITQVLHNLDKKGKLNFLEKKVMDRKVIYHDACRMGRKIKNMDIYEEPRDLLKKVGTEIIELEKNRKDSMCCGAGSGIRGVDKDLCINIGANVLEETDSNPLVSSCPLCVFNYRYVNYKKNLGKQIYYITDFIYRKKDS